MKTRHLANKNEVQESPAGEAVAAVGELGRRPRVWLFGAYTLLFLWGATYLVLFFTDRLPI